MLAPEVWTVTNNAFVGGGRFVFNGGVKTFTSNGFFAQDWLTATAYAADEFVYNSAGGDYYVCISAHTSGDTDDEPGVGATEATYWLGTYDGTDAESVTDTIVSTLDLGTNGIPGATSDLLDAGTDLTATVSARLEAGYPEIQVRISGHSNRAWRWPRASCSALTEKV